MFGFAGQLAIDRRPGVDAVERRAETTGDRGPDGRGSWAEGPVALAHRRLKVIDLSSAGDQPLVDEDAAIDFDGCIYNDRELRAELVRAGHRLASSSDAEGDGALHFASTLPALPASGGVDASLDPVAVHQFPSWDAVLAPPATILQGVHKQAPATATTVEADGSRATETYRQASSSRDLRFDGWDAEDWSQAVLGAPRTAVRRRMFVPHKVVQTGQGADEIFAGHSWSRLEGATLELVSETFEGPAASARGRFRADHVDELLEAPDDHLTTLEGSELGPLLFELWPARHGI